MICVLNYNLPMENPCAGYTHPKHTQSQMYMDGITTDIAITSKNSLHTYGKSYIYFKFVVFSDRFFVIISQRSKFGTLFSCWSDNSELIQNKKIFHSQILLGKRDDEILDIYARQITELFAVISSKPLLLSLMLDDTKKEDQMLFRAIMDKLTEMLSS